MLHIGPNESEMSISHVTMHPSMAPQLYNKVLLLLLYCSHGACERTLDCSGC